MLEIIVRVIALVLAVAALPGAVLRVLPLRSETSHRLLPLLMTATGIGCWYASLGVVIGVAAVIPASWLAGVLGIEMVPAEPMNWAPAKKLVRRVAGKATATATATVKLLSRAPAIPPEPDVEIREFAKPDADYILRDDTATHPAREAGDDESADLEPPAMQTQVKKFVPSLLD